MNLSGDLTYTVFFRTSKVFGKSPIESVDSRLTFCSLLESFSLGEIVCIADNASEEQSLFFASNSLGFYRTNKGNSGSFRLAIELADLHPADIYYFVEDDHLHLPDQKSYLAAGLQCFDFVSLYDHPDKYQDSCYRGLQRKLLATPVGHFSSSPSTVMTFACKLETLRRARGILLDSSFTGETLKTPRDHEMFIALAEKGFALGTALPGRSTHCERQLLSPYVNWSAYALSLAEKYRLY
ncbi:hypothetical protein ETE01_01125 [Synechococcus sp. HB1133]|uniref:hypothetical protein n=1 Tax=Synechococcus sp. HBA1120 TaxID=2508341 RepID=UPI001CF926B9|nr:hypothetical protein [Synechococcus sp. HBA1120]NHI80382.1 hypothetical protein [Synechococcus sp. HB1133]